MKKLIYNLMTVGVLLFTSCSDFTDIQPKGKNLLSTTDEIEMLLNSEFYLSSTDAQMMSGDMLTLLSNVANELNQPNKTRQAIMITFDATNQDKMAELTSNDSQYSDYYNIIGRIANVVLSQIEAATGPEEVKNRLKCEALVLRAYFHYLLVNKFAKAYNPSTAATDPGIPYLKEDWDIMVPTRKETVETVYNYILEDLNKAIEINALPDEAINRMRISKPCAYAAKALALISMQRFDEAEQAAQDALAINGAVDDYNAMTTTYTGNIIGGKYEVILRPRLQCKEDLFYTEAIELFHAIMPCAWNAFEEGHASRDKMTTDRMMYDNMMGMGTSMIGLDYTFTFDLNSGWNGVGMKTTHMYLIIAEAEIRKGNYDEAMAALDKIRINRIDPDIYLPLEGTVDNETDAIFHLKQTSHGENIYSCYNFINRKRWNQLEEKYQETIVRDLEGIGTYEMGPDSPMWIFPFPVDAVNNNPNLTQNYKEL